MASSADRMNATATSGTIALPYPDRSPTRPGIP